VPPAVFAQFKVPQPIINDAEWKQDKWHVATVNGVDIWQR
jgi:hypothetical protein